MIAAVNGMACGGAFYLLGEADILIAADHATFFDPHVTYGMPAVFEPALMLHRMPFGEVMRMTLLGNHERISAARALEIGLVTEVVPHGRRSPPRPTGSRRRSHRSPPPPCKPASARCGRRASSPAARCSTSATPSSTSP